MNRLQYVIVFLLVLKSGCLISQPQFGVRAGVNFSNTRCYFDEYNWVDEIGRFYYHNYRIAPAASVYGDFEINDLFVLSAELGYSGMGSVSKYNYRNYTFRYLNLPLLLKYTPDKAFHVYAGTSVNYLLNGGRGTSVFSKMDAGLQAGMEYYIKPAIGLGFRYYWGLVNVSRPSININSFEDHYTREIYNRSLQLYCVMPLVPKKNRKA